MVTSRVQFTRKVDPMRHIWPPFLENTIRGLKAKLGAGGMGK